MSTLPPAPVSEPFTAADLARDFSAVREWGSAFWQAVPADRFFESMDGAWSPADHVRHLIKSNRAVARALDMPGIVLLLRFGFTTRASRSYTALRATYREALDAGLRAGSFTPSPLGTPQQTADERARILDNWSVTLTTLESGARKWSERALNKLRLPHPGLGSLTVREMLFFTLYHNTHHVHGVAKRQ